MLHELPYDGEETNTWDAWEWKKAEAQNYYYRALDTVEELLRVRSQQGPELPGAWVMQAEGLLKGLRREVEVIGDEA